MLQVELGKAGGQQNQGGGGIHKRQDESQKMALDFLGKTQYSYHIHRGRMTSHPEARVDKFELWKECWQVFILRVRRQPPGYSAIPHSGTSMPPPIFCLKFSYASNYKFSDDNFTNPIRIQPLTQDVTNTQNMGGKGCTRAGWITSKC